MKLPRPSLASVKLAGTILLPSASLLGLLLALRHPTALMLDVGAGDEALLHEP